MSPTRWTMSRRAATDFFTTQVWTQGGLVTYYVVFFIHLATRRVHVAGITPHPNEQWMTQVARNVTMADVGFVSSSRYLIHDRDSKFCESFHRTIEAVGVLCQNSDSHDIPKRRPTALGDVANTDTKLLICSLFQKSRVLAQDGVRYGVSCVAKAATWLDVRWPV